MPARIEHREMSGKFANGIALLEAVTVAQPEGACSVTLFFGPDTDLQRVGFPQGYKVRSIGTFGSSPVVLLSAPHVGKFELKFEGRPVEVTPVQPELSLFENTNAIAGYCNGESADTVVTWLAHHAATQGMTATVLLDRNRPHSAKAFDAELAAGVSALPHDLTVIVLRSALPLGRRDLPAESHPSNAPSAPGKHRMKIPPPAPWLSPLGALHVYELMRHRFLGTARAVANIDVCDLLLDDGSQTAFDRAASSNGGVIPLLGRTCYPWRVRKDEPVRFADHICVEFDSKKRLRRWCVAPDKVPDKAQWRLNRIGHIDPVGVPVEPFFRYVNLRHPSESVSQIVQKTTLVEDKSLIEMSARAFDHKPVRPAPVEVHDGQHTHEGSRTIVTTMKNEGPFILEWLAYHRAIGFDNFLVYTNDCTDGTDTMFDLLQAKGFLQHRENPFREMKLKPQHAALRAAADEPLVKDAKWVVCIDVDEFINIKVGDGTLDDLFGAVPDANMISMTWRLFGNDDISYFLDEPIIQQFTRCAPEFIRTPHQAWGFKTLFQNRNIFKKLGVHRPKGLKAQLVDKIRWVNGSGAPMPESMYRNSWRSTVSTYGYDLVQLNHYAVRCSESFLVKRDRGRVNHVDRDQGLAYWFRMNNNSVTDTSIKRMLPALEREMAVFLSDPEIQAAHESCVAMHREKIDALRATSKYSKFFDELNSDRMRKLAIMHNHFGAEVFLSGPECIPDEIAARDPGEDFFFTV